MKPVTENDKIETIARVTDIDRAQIMLAFLNDRECKMEDMSEEAYKSAQMTEEARYRTKASATVMVAAFTMAAEALPMAAALCILAVCGVWVSGWWATGVEEKERAQNIINAGVAHYHFRHKADAPAAAQILPKQAVSSPS